MPARILVQLRPARPTTVPPEHTGPAINAAFLGAVGRADKELATRLHDSPKFKSFTLSPLLGEDNRPPTAPGVPAWFQVGLLTDTHTATVLTALQSTLALRIGRSDYRVDSARLVAAQSYREIAAHAQPRTRWAVRLVTPVSFASPIGTGARREFPWPDAARVFDNLARRWERFAADVRLPESVWTAIDAHLEASGGDVRITDHLIEPSRRAHRDGYRHGAVGTVEYHLAAPEDVPPAGCCALDALCQFATYAGFGDRTAFGMGCVRLPQV